MTDRGGVGLAFLTIRGTPLNIPVRGNLQQSSPTLTFSGKGGIPAPLGTIGVPPLSYLRWHPIPMRGGGGRGIFPSHGGGTPTISLDPEHARKSVSVVNPFRKPGGGTTLSALEGVTPFFYLGMGYYRPRAGCNPHPHLLAPRHTPTLRHLMYAALPLMEGGCIVTFCKYSGDSDTT